MATLGRSPGAAPLTSADIPDDSITGAKIVDDAIDSEHYAAGSVDAAHVAADVASTVEAASTNLTGAVSSRYFLSLAYVLTGDVTLSGTNVLANIAGGTNVSITNDGSTRTLSGSGTLLVNSAMFN